MVVGFSDGGYTSLTIPLRAVTDFISTNHAIPSEGSVRYTLYFMECTRYSQTWHSIKVGVTHNISPSNFSDKFGYWRYTHSCTILLLFYVLVSRLVLRQLFHLFILIITIILTDASMILPKDVTLHWTRHFTYRRRHS